MRSLWLIVVMVLAGCSSTATSVPQTVGVVDLPRYQGLWYEQARLPMFFQRGCVSSEARYTLQEDGALTVHNRCLTEAGEWKDAYGQATAQEGAQDRFWVEFDNVVSHLLPGVTRGHYWVFYLDENYTEALVGNPDRKYLWLLTRSEKPSPESIERLLAEAKKRGFATDKLIWRQ